MMQQVLGEMRGAYHCWRAGLLRLDRPARLLAGSKALRRYGAIGGMIVMSAGTDGERVALIDERGPLTFNELDRRSNAIAHALRGRGVQPGDAVGLLARNHRGFLDALFAAAKCGARIVLLNTDFAGRQVRDVVQREGIQLLVHDEEYTDEVQELELRHGRILAWTDAPNPESLDALAAGKPRTLPPAPSRMAELVILTSGTTGQPRGAVREEPRGLTIAGGILERVPFRAAEVTECCAPMFHALGLAQALLALGLGSTVVMRRKFDAGAVLDSVERNRATALIVVPAMLQKMLENPDGVERVRRARALRVIFVAGSQLGGELCRSVIAAFGPVVYNLYGSTEVAYVSIATPADLGAEPSTVGRVVRGVAVRILDDDGNEVPTGVTGRIFAGSSIQFQGYTGGGTRESIGRLMSSGDLGHLDEVGRLYIDGREDDMIVSGGENVFPGEVEEVLAAHPEVVESAAIGVPDPDFGQRLRVFVVRREASQLDENGVRDFVRASLARFKVPRDVFFLDELPRNPTGKVLKTALGVYAPGDSVSSS